MLSVVWQLLAGLVTQRTARCRGYIEDICRSTCFQHVDKSEDAKPGESDGKSILMKGWDGLALPNQIRPAEHLGKWPVNFAQLPNTQVGVGVKFSTKLVTVVPGKKATRKRRTAKQCSDTASNLAA